MSSRHGADEECERELQKEEEEEEEEERQMPRMQARQQESWNMQAALAATTASSLSQCISLIPLPQLVAQHMHPSNLSSIPWCKSVLATSNFVHTVVLPARSSNLSDYMRHVDALLLFADGNVLLLSEREADACQAMIWQTQQTKSSIKPSTAATHSSAPMLLQLCYARLAKEQRNVPLLAHKLDSTPICRATLHTLLTWRCLTNLQLFHGETMFAGSSNSSFKDRIRSPPFTELRRLMCRKRVAAEELLSLRGKLRMLPKSDLELASEDDGCGQEAV